MRTCPECPSNRTHRSRARNPWDAWRPRAGELNTVSPEDIDRLDPAPAIPTNRDGVVIFS